MAWMMRIMRMALNAVFGALLVALLSISVALFGIPAVFSGTNLVVLSGSMEPGIKPGDIVVTRGIDSASESGLAIGDVIAFLPYPDDPTVVTHRIVGVSTKNEEIFYVTKGDNNKTTDPWGPVAASHVRGKAMYTVPKLGYAKQWAGDHTGATVTAAGVLLIGYGVCTFFCQKTRKTPVPQRVWSE